MSDDATLVRIRRCCLAFPSAAEATLQDRPLFHVGRKRFALYNAPDAPARRRWDGAGWSLHVLTDPEERDALGADPRFRPSAHHGDRGWLALDLSAADTWDEDAWAEVAELLEAAYRQAAPRALVAELDQRRRPPRAR